MQYAKATGLLTAYRRQITEIHAAMRRVQAEIEPQEVRDYSFCAPQGDVTLAALFGDKDDLFVIHNMGASCPYCTLWADGYNGAYQHLASRAAFVLSTPDDVEVQMRLAQSRGWRFPMVSHARSPFAADMGYRTPTGTLLPGVSVFQRRKTGIFRVSDTQFNHEDEFCPAWRLFDMLPEGANGWQPKFSY